MSAITEPTAELGDHVVHFYRDDADLAEVVAGHLADALHDGTTAVVIATRPHVLDFKRELEMAGIDVEEASAAGRLILLDALSTLGELGVDGRIDREAFRRTVGTVVRNALAGGKAVRAYGEMVDLLWQSGDIPDAIELERLWNELIAELRFSLFCAYHSEAVAAPGHEQALHHVCQLHTAISSADEASRQFQPGDRAPFAARRFIDMTLRRWGHSGAVIDDARLLVSELVTNAVVHANSPLSVSISWRRPKLRLSVRDASPVPPAPREERANGAIGGHGLGIVADLSSAWGVDLSRDGKVVWAEL